ncbi:MAG: CRISPR system precrRNA processing endoribonuclease RAMP protein Cas6 [Candidatus Bathyarchaeota archaeon]|nr:CRISPR system precrRNA processing endoribonuclease RAMP protein Cas6 [Candidatus Bathyarchaeota archaeon]
MSSISTFTLRFIVEKPIIFQSFSGFASCGVFYSLVKSIDEELALKLHSSKRLAPWAASPIHVEFPQPQKIVYRLLQAPSIASITFTIMDENLSDIFEDALLKPDLHIDLVNVKAKAIGVTVNTCKFSDMLSNADPLPEKFAVKFLTPTVFRRSIYDCCTYCPYYAEYMHAAREGKRLEKPCKHAAKCGGITVPLPIPSLMFRNMARLWSAFSGISLDVWGAARWAESAIAIAGFPKPGIRTVRVYEHPTTNKWIAGFMGTVRFTVKQEAYREKYAKIAAALLKMAEVTNVGIRRTAGLGMIRCVMPTEKQNQTRKELEDN